MIGAVRTPSPCQPCLPDRLMTKVDERHGSTLHMAAANYSLHHGPASQETAAARGPQWVQEGSFILITINCVPRNINQLCRKGPGDAVLKAAAHYHDNLIWFCLLTLLMPDHLHGIISFPREPGPKKIVKEWKKYLARMFGICWQRDFFDHRLRDHHELEEKIGYILANPMRKGLCDKSEDWPWIYRPVTRPPPMLS
jgi:putative transposase